jgi:hypothetical protein
MEYITAHIFYIQETFLPASNLMWNPRLREICHWFPWANAWSVANDLLTTLFKFCVTDLSSIYFQHCCYYILGTLDFRTGGVNSVRVNISLYQFLESSVN